MTASAKPISDYDQRRISALRTATRAVSGDCGNICRKCFSAWEAEPGFNSISAFAIAPASWLSLRPLIAAGTRITSPNGSGSEIRSAEGNAMIGRLAISNHRFAMETRLNRSGSKLKSAGPASGEYRIFRSEINRLIRSRGACKAPFCLSLWRQYRLQGESIASKENRMKLYYSPAPAGLRPTS